MLRKSIRWFGLISGILIVFVILLRLEIIGTPMVNMSFRYSDDKIKEIFADEPRVPSIGHITFEGKQIRYIFFEEDPSLPYVIFIHGAPGSSFDYFDFFKDEKLYQHFNILSIDRLGYGYSDFGNSETSLQKQAESLTSVVKSISKNNKIILVGHSYGGPIVLQMSADSPTTYSNIILLAPAIDPENEKEIPLARLGVNPWIRWLIPPALRVAADEKTTHVSELKKLEPLLTKINTPICHIHGTKDSLVPYENVVFSKKQFQSVILEIITLENVDHFLPWTHHQLIVEKLLQINDSK